VIKHEYSTCCCSTDQCCYDKSNIKSFLKEYYTRIGEAASEEGGEKLFSTSKQGSSTKVTGRSRQLKLEMCEEAASHKENGFGHQEERGLASITASSNELGIRRQKDAAPSNVSSMMMLEEGMTEKAGVE